MIGIFGDSYADPLVGGSEDLAYKSWVYQLRDSMITHGKGGTSILWSYRQFLRHHEKYDRIIFIMTNPDRLDHVGDNNDWSLNHFVTGPLQADMILLEGNWKNILSKDYWINKHKWNIPRTQAYRDWYKWQLDPSVENQKILNIQCGLIRESILSQRPDTILITMGHWGFDWTEMPKGSECYDYQCLQSRSLFPDRPDFSRRNNNQLGRHFHEINCANHFTPEINQLFASHVKLALNGEGWQDWGVNDIPSIPHSKPWDYYYSPFK
jgi:hypothetical protein